MDDTQLKELDTNEFRWSYSRVNSFPDESNKFDGCAYSWFLTYKQHDRGIGNAFSEWGLSYHKAIQEYINNDIFLFELKDRFNELINQCNFKFPPNKYVNLRDRTYTGIMDHFDDFSWLDKYKILSCEEKRKYDLNGLPFVSIADLEVETIDKKIGILDHKISTTFKKSDLKNKLKQLYIYSYSFRDKHGQLPDELIFNHFKNNEIIHHEFNKQEYENNINWLINKIEFISKQTEFLPRCELLNEKQKKNDFYAMYLCGHRKTCPFRLFRKEK